MFDRDTEEVIALTKCKNWFISFTLKCKFVQNLCKISALNIHEVGRFFSQKYFSYIHILTKSMCFLDLLYLKVHKKCSPERK